MSGSKNGSDARLNLLLDVTKAINDNYSREQLIKIYESILKNVIKLPRYVVFSQDGKSQLKEELVHGLDIEMMKESEYDVVRYLLHLENIHETTVIEDSFLGLFDVVIPIYHKETTLAFIIAGFDEPVEDWEDALKFVQALSNIIYVAFENKKLAKQRIAQERIKKELELASDMQGMLLPRELPKTRELTVDAIYKAHDEIGGDYYDFFKLNDNEYALCIADVSGKGISAALLMSNFQANVRALFRYIPSLEELANLLNQKVMENAKGEKFITAFLAKYNLSNRTLSYINCGHNPPVLVQESKLELLKEGSLGLGMLEELPFVKMKELKLGLEALLVCYTDGLTELEDNEENLFGLESLKELIRDNRELEVSDLMQKIIYQMNKFKGENPYKDDIAIMACRFH